ncbi:MAG: MgtC/SapB family protein [Oscillospiraceae bacterium]|nr:MgtC/SapB family protein [Oscillospiraceae bacterium]
MYAQIREMLSEISVLSVFCRLSLALLCGGIIGIERGIKRRAAGFRTYMLVCVGATLVMITNQYITEIYQSDPARLGAQVISGIGFLGAGTIIVTRHHQVIGLTTAAGLWASACMGLAIGIGFYEGAILGSFFIFFIITVMHKLDNKVVSNSRSIDIYVELTDDGKLSELLNHAHKNMLKVDHVEIINSKYSEGRAVAATVSLRLPKRNPHYEVIEQLQKLNCVAYIEEI